MNSTSLFHKINKFSTNHSLRNQCDRPVLLGKHSAMFALKCKERTKMKSYLVVSLFDDKSTFKNEVKSAAKSQINRV